MNASPLTVADFFPTAVVYGGPVTNAVRGAGGRRWLLSRMAAVLAAGGTVACLTTDPGADAAVRRALEAVGVTDRPADVATVTNRGIPYFGQHDFAAVVGLWLDQTTGGAADLLSPYISREGFSFTPAEFVEMRDRVQRAIRHYTRLPQVSSALDDLNTGLFRFQQLEESRTFVTERLAGFRTRARTLHRDYLSAINRYARASHLAELTVARRRQERIDELRRAAGSVRKQEGRPARRAWQRLLQQLEGYRRDYPAGDHPLPTAPDGVASFLDEEAALLRRELHELPRRLQADGLGLSPLTAREDRGDREALDELGQRLLTLIREIDEAGLYQLPVAGQEAATTPRQLKVLEQLLHRLETTRLHLPEYDDFYRRRQFWYAQPAPLRRLLGPLTELPTTDWDAAFRAWYLEHCLLRAGETPPPALDLAALTDLAERSAETPPLPVAKWSDRLYFTPQPGATLTVDLTGQERGDLNLYPLTAPAATALRLGGLRRSELVFQQPFVPLRPPAFRSGGTPQIRPEVPAAPYFMASEGEELAVHLPHTGDYDGAADFVADWPRLVVRGAGLRIHHDWPSGAVTAALLSDGITARFLAAVLIRSLEYATADPFEARAYAALGAEVRGRYQLERDDRHPLAESVARRLRPLLPQHFVETHVGWRDLYLPLVVTAPSGRKTVLLPQGQLYPLSPDLTTEARRQRELRRAGFALLPIDATACWRDAPAELAALADQLE